MRTNYLLEANNEEDYDMNNELRNKTQKLPISIREAASENYVDNKYNDPRMIENTTHVNFNEKNIHSVRFVKVNSAPAWSQQLTLKQSVDGDIDKTSLVRNNWDNNFNKFNLTNINCLTLNSQTNHDT